MRTAIALTLTLSSFVTQAFQWDPWIKPGFTKRNQNHRTSTSSIEADSFFIEARLGASDSLSEEWSWSFDARAKAFTEEASLIDDNDLERTLDNDENYYLQLREAWVRYSGLTDYPKEYLTFGLQRLRERTGLWWDVDIESLSWYGDTTQLDWTIVVGQEFETFRTESELLPQNQEVFRVFGGASWDWQAYHSVDIRFAYADQNNNQLLDENRLYAKGQNANVSWLAIGLSSEWTEQRYASRWAYRFEWIQQRGDATFLGSTNQAQLKDINSYAIDTGIRYSLSNNPIFIGLTYVKGSGGSSDTETNNFSQTGLHTNRGRYFGNNQYMYRFNEALRADLTNLQQISAFLSWEPNASWQTVVMLGIYEKNNDQQPIFVTGRPIDSVAGKKSIGKSVDVNLTYFPQNPILWNMNLLRFRAGIFKPESGLTDQSTDYRMTLEAQFRY